MAAFEAPNPNFAADVERGVMSLPAARLLGFRFVRLAPGETDLELPFRDELSSRGVFQGGILGALADFAGGSAAATLLPLQAYSVTADYTVKLLAPAIGEMIIAQARAAGQNHHRRAGRSLRRTRRHALLVRDGARHDA